MEMCNEYIEELFKDERDLESTLQQIKAINYEGKRASCYTAAGKAKGQD